MKLYDCIQRPPVYADASSIWTDEHIARQMLLAHLSDENDAASYRPERRQRICKFLHDRLSLEPGMRLLDLGCGPGLYAQWFAQRGLEVIGIDISANSIAYAQQQALQAGLSIRYQVGDYRQPLSICELDAAIMVSDDYGVMCPADRATLLGNIYSALKPGGVFAMDVPGTAALSDIHREATWIAEESGFWRPHPCVVLKKTHMYPEAYAWCTVYAVCDDAITVYYTSQTTFTKQRIEAELRDAGFRDVEVYGDLEGTLYRENEKQIGIIVRK